MSLRFLPRRLGVFALLAFLLSSALPPTVGAAGPAGYPGPREMATVRFRDLDAAVAAGALDASVLAEVRAKGQARAIVTFDGDGILAEAQAKAPSGKGRGAAIAATVRPAFAALKARAVGSGSGIRVLRQYDVLAASFVSVPSSGTLLQLLNRMEVTGVRQNHRSKAALIESLDLVDQPEAAADGYLGAGTSIAVLDTGLDYTREAFGLCTAPGFPETCKVPYADDFAPDDFLLDDGVDGDEGTPDCVVEGQCHGTNVAAIALGVAPGAKVIGLDVFRDDGQSYTSDLLAALNWVVGNQAAYNIRAANLSLALEDSFFTATCYDSPLEPALASVRAVGVLPVIAAGNSAEASGSFTNGIAYPACTKGAVSVGAVYDSDIYTADGSYFGCDGPVPTAADQITCFSQSASILSLLGPGAMITAAAITQGGTSQAAPHVAGAAAVLAAAKLTATPTAIETALKNSGPSIIDTRPEPDITRRRLDLDAAVDYLLAAAVGVTWEPTLYVGPTTGAIGTGSYGGSLSQTVSGSIRYLHNIHTNWAASPPGIQYVRGTRDGATWGAPKRLNSTSHDGDWPVTAAAGTYVYAAWVRFTSTSRFVQFKANASHGSGSGWSGIKTLSPSSGRTDLPSLAATGSKVFATWTDSITGAIRVARSLDNGANWSTASVGTTTRTNGTQRWGQPVIAASGSNVIVAWIANNTGTLTVRRSSSSGSSWLSSTNLDSDSVDRAAVAAVGSRLVVAWVDNSYVRLRMWVAGTLQPLRNVYQFTTASSGYDAGYNPAIAPVGTGGKLGVAWAGCRTSNCAGTTAGSAINLLWRESTTNGSSWSSGPVLLSAGNETYLRRINDAPDIEWGGLSRRFVSFNGWTPDGATRMYQRNGRG